MVGIDSKALKMKIVSDDELAIYFDESRVIIVNYDDGAVNYFDESGYTGVTHTLSNREMSLMEDIFSLVESMMDNTADNNDAVNMPRILQSVLERDSDSDEDDSDSDNHGDDYNFDGFFRTRGRNGNGTATEAVDGD